MTLSVLFAGLLAYFLGSVPTSVWYGQAFFGIDVREHGSGNAGATNTFRTLGKKAGTIVLLIDVLKGWLAANLALILFYLNEITLDERVPMKLAFGIIAVIGHLFPVFARFKGGKGVATLLGMVLSIHPEAAGVCILVFLLMMLSSRYISLSSIVATLAFPLMMVFNLFGPEHNLLVIFGFILFGLIVYTHHKNIGRLLRGEEARIPIGRRRSR